jgi:hypothetical protein
VVVRKCTRIRLDIRPLFFHIVPKFVQALVIRHDEIFKALAVKEDVLLPKPFMDLSHHRTIRFGPSDFLVFGKLKNYLRSRRFPRPSDDTVKAEVQKWLREQDVSFYRKDLENLIVR